MRRIFLLVSAARAARVHQPEPASFSASCLEAVWRHDGGAAPDKTAFPFFTREDALYKRTAHYAHGFISEQTACFPGKEGTVKVLVKPIPKTGSQTLVKTFSVLGRRFPCRGVEPAKLIVATFVKHPFPRVVSAFESITALFSHHGGCAGAHACNSLYWRRYTDLQRATGASAFVDVMVAAPPGAAAALFDVFVDDVLARGMRTDEIHTRRGVEPILHHIRSHMYFLSGRSAHPHGGRVDFVGRMDSPDTLIRDFTHLVAPAIGADAFAALRREPPFATMLNSTEAAHKRTPRDMRSKEIVRGLLAPKHLAARTLETIRNYFVQDFECFGYDADPTTWATEDNAHRPAAT